jgi:Protein of unknown function (DUF5132)
MSKHTLETSASLEGSAGHLEVPETQAVESDSEDRNELVATIATVAVVGIGAAVFEAALLPGLVLGVAAMSVPRFFPRIGSALHPLFRSTVRGAYQIGYKTREMVAEAQERVQDIIAEVDAEIDGPIPSKEKSTGSPD